MIVLRNNCVNIMCHFWKINTILLDFVYEMGNYVNLKTIRNESGLLSPLNRRDHLSVALFSNGQFPFVSARHFE